MAVYDLANDSRVIDNIKEITNKYPKDIEMRNYILGWACKLGNIEGSLI